MATLALVTGAGGFLGRYVAEQLVARGDRVRGFSRGDYPELAELGVELVRGDLRDPQQAKSACEGVDVVYHVGGKPGVWGPWTEYYEINTLGTQHLIQGCLEHGVGRFVYTSSPSVTFNGGDQVNVDETEPYPDRWLCHYPHSKALAEQYVLEHNGRSHGGQAPKSGKLWTCALRPHLIWGPRDGHLVPRMIDRAKSGRLRVVGDGQNLVDTVYVENAAQAHRAAADRLTEGSPVCGQAYFISQGEPVNCWAWINDVVVMAGLPPLTKRISARAAYVAGGMLEAIHTVLPFLGEPQMTRFVAAQLSTSHYFDLSKAEADLDYRPQVSIAEGMQRLADDLQHR
ncbi:MAG: NAD-dependent epimerase/dehydratase family protein [Planctomycetales bacterium]